MVVASNKSNDEIKKELLKERERLEFEISRSEKMLLNPAFVSKAPKQKVDLERSKLEENKAKMKGLEQRISEVIILIKLFFSKKISKKIPEKSF